MSVPHETTIRWIALGLLALVLLWVLVSAVGLTPRAIRLRRGAKQDGGATLRCGACDHPAVSLGQINECPECGARYDKVGLRAPGTGIRRSVPIWILAVLLLGVCALGTVEFGPRAAAMANRRVAGADALEHWRSKAALVPYVGSGPASTPLPLAVELDRELVGPATAPTGTRSGGPLAGTFQLRLSLGTAPDAATSTWKNDPTVKAIEAHASQSIYMMGSINAPGPPSPSPSPEPGSLQSPWRALHSTNPTATLRWSLGGTRWTLSDNRGGNSTRGTGLDDGLRAAFDRLGVDTTGTTAGAPAVNVFETMRELVADPRIPRMGSIRASSRGVHYIGALRLFNELHATPTQTAFHRTMPWSMAAFAAVPVGLLAISAAIFWLACRGRHRGNIS